MIKKIEPHALHNLAYQEIKRMILSKHFKAGEKIGQEKLAEELGISRTPLRAALQMLESEQYLESIPNRGVFVKKFSKKEIVDIFDCRIALECMAVKLFTLEASDDLLNELVGIFSPFKEGESISLPEYRDADDKFHRLIQRGSGNQFLSDLFKKGNLQWAISYLGLLRPPEETLQEHLDIIEAVLQKNAELAEERMRHHLSLTRELVAQQIADE